MRRCTDCFWIAPLQRLRRWWFGTMSHWYHSFGLLLEMESDWPGWRLQSNGDLGIILIPHMCYIYFKVILGSPTHIRFFKILEWWLGDHWIESLRFQPSKQGKSSLINDDMWVYPWENGNTWYGNPLVFPCCLRFKFWTPARTSSLLAGYLRFFLHIWDDLPDNPCDTNILTKMLAQHVVNMYK